MTLFTLDAFVELVKEHRELAFRSFLPDALVHRASHHWNANIESMALRALRVLLQIDPVLYHSLSNKPE